MSTTERPDQDTIESLVTYPDGAKITAARLDRPGNIVRLERAYPDVRVGERTSFKAEMWYFLTWLSLRADLPAGDPHRPADTFDEWLDQVEDVVTGNPTPSAAKPKRTKLQAAR